MVESSWHIAESEGHPIALEEPQVTHSEGSILLRCLVHSYLPKSGLQIQARKVASIH